jgi:hypothetical protein
MNRNTPLIVLSSLLGSLAIYCSSAFVPGGSSPVGDAHGDTPSAGACCSNPPSFTKLTEGDLSVIEPIKNHTSVNQGADIDVSGYRQVTVLETHSDSCLSAYAGTQFRADAASATWGTGMPPGSVPIPVLGPIMRVTLSASTGSYDSTTCSATGHYIVLGLK